MAEAYGYELRANNTHSLQRGEAAARRALRKQWRDRLGQAPYAEERTVTTDGNNTLVEVIWRALDG